MHVCVGMAEADLDEVAAAMSDAFAEYPLPMAFTRSSLIAMCEADDVVLEACALARTADGQLAGVGLGGLRDECGRVAAMGVVRSAHRRGVGRALGEAVLESLRVRGARRVILEALTVNASALALYEERLGFTRCRRLVGFTRPPGGGPIDAARWDEALLSASEPASWQLARVVRSVRGQDDLVSVPAVVPERHPVATLLRESGFVEAEIDQYELEREL